MKKSQVRKLETIAILQANIEDQHIMIAMLIINLLMNLLLYFTILGSYDGHFIIKEASNYTENIQVIAQSFEKYMTFMFCKLRFIDSFQFVSASLEKLVDSLITDDYNNFVHTKKYFKDNTKLLCQKGVYPYEYVKDVSVFNDSCLPPIEQFYSKLTEKSIDDDEYEHALNVWNVMQCKNFGDYHDLYLKSDVLLLSDVFECFRKRCRLNYNLDPLNYFSTPGFSWDAMLQSTKCELGYIHDDETRLFLESGKRGGIVMAGGKRYAVANNKYMSNYDCSKESSYITYLDMNNLYGAAMCDVLPHKLNGFVDITLDEILNTPDDAPIGYFVKCDIKIDQSLHNKFKDYPLFEIDIEKDSFQHI